MDGAGPTGVVGNFNYVGRLLPIRGKSRQIFDLRVELDNCHAIIRRQRIQEAPGSLLKLLSKVYGRP